ncbi:hypothetical protein NZD89_12720 [Alicyclobacillus fastidiosus]|uniref:Transmembrane protein n=1 Tax=Alicyclobacillus fastidiosus TaxID=392011 RepID=A0ABY6ZMU3_9BACL|nr:hypothetical protein [Alicyclobacillus fastidiosus]WAH44161.1 hypothetical protein NZD89_12720 [Alicyclobacillus fastidiosus]GMA60469.1 hypothetical protein GCM10025859_09090 [Alicyclobacillus fastidiosus]
MSLAVCVFITWCVILILALIPKKLTALEMVFLFFVCTIFELSAFTLFHLNLHWMDVSKSVEKALADLVMRLICVPVVLVITSNFLLYSSRLLKWCLVAVVVLSGVMLQKSLVWLGILTTPHWNVGYTAFMFCGYITFARLMTWFIIYIKKTEGKVT